MSFPGLPDESDFPDAAVTAEQATATPAPATDSDPEHARMLELALENMSHGLCVYDADGRLQMFNKRYLEINGFAPNEIKFGWTFTDLMRHQVRKGNFDGVADSYAAELNAELKENRFVERHHGFATGRSLVITHTLTANGERVVTHHDVTNQVRAEAERDRSKAFLDAVIANVPAVVMVKDIATGRYLLINKLAEHYLGLSADEVIGKTPHELYDLEDAERVTAFDRRVIAGECDSVIGAPFHATESPNQVVRTRKKVINGQDGKPLYIISIVEDITERAQAAERVAYMARYDALTGLGNRTLLTEAIDRLLRDQQRNTFNLLLLDLDHFKDVNESLGHPVGDALLMAIAARLKALIGKDDIIARLSGDEFAILQMASADQADGAVDLANRVLEVLMEPAEFEGHQVVVGASIGIAFAHEHGEDADELVQSADLALNRAKTRGRNQYQIFNSTMEKEATVRRTLELELRRALVDQEFVLRYQPVVNALNQEIAGVEALVRWNSPVKGLVPPDRFIPLAEETGLIVPLGEWVMRRACMDAAQWPEDIKVAVNLSAIQFSKGDIVGLVSDALEESGLAPERLELEITETVLLHKNEDNISLLHALKNLGVAIVLDDFGTGYSSLSYLKMFPFDKIKIDRSFINDLSTRTDCAAIVCAVTGLGRSLNITTTAEGVETQEQFTLLRAVGCTQIQGYLFGRPTPASELPFATADQRASRDASAFKAALATPAVYPDATDLPRQIA